MCADIANGRFRPLKLRVQHSAGDFWPELPFQTGPGADINQRNENITRVIVSLHGTGGDAIQYYNRAADAVGARPELIDHTLVVAPQFFYNDPGDASRSEVNGTFNRRIIYWHSGRAWGNNSGNNSVNPRTFFTRSYHVMDRFLEHLTRKDLFPNLRLLVLIGHSNGGQFIGRYAAINTFEEQYAKDRGVHIRYMPMNAGTYLYLTDRRWRFISDDYKTTATLDTSWTSDVTEVSNPGSGCGNYNDWPWGLQGLSGSRIDYQEIDQIIDKFARRDVVYMVGENDTSSGGYSDCWINRQGDNRLAVALLNYYGLQQVYGSSITDMHKLVVVPGIGHNGRAMMTSPRGLDAIFEPAPELRRYGMTSLADYKVIRDTKFSLRPGQERSFEFSIYRDTVGSGGSKRPVLSYFADPSGDARNLTYRIFLNGTEIANYSYSGGVGRGHQEVLSHGSINAGETNVLEFRVQSGEGSVGFSDVILWFQRNID
jgi:hypothetical protein